MQYFEDFASLILFLYFCTRIKKRSDSQKAISLFDGLLQVYNSKYDKIW